jgi:hypothetical protein
MELLLLLLVVGMIAYLSSRLERRWRAMQRQKTHATPTPGASSAGADVISQIVGGWQKRSGWSARSAQDQARLRAWLNSNLAGQPLLQAWVAGLTDDEFNHFQQQVQASCSTMNIDLTWLNEQPLNNDPTLLTTVQRIVLLVVHAQQEAASVQTDLRAFQIYRAIELHPYSYEYQPLIQQLYTQLVNAGLTAPARPEALLATEKIRVEHMLRAIEAAANADRPAFYRIVNGLDGLSQQDGPTAPLPVTGNSQPVAAVVS